MKKTGANKMYCSNCEFEVNDEKIIRELNTYNFNDRIGMGKEIYYFDNDMGMVYEKGSEIFLIIFPIVGTITAILGALLAFHRKVQNWSLESYRRYFY